MDKPGVPVGTELGAQARRSCEFHTRAPLCSTPGSPWTTSGVHYGLHNQSNKADLMVNLVLEASDCTEV